MTEIRHSTCALDCPDACGLLVDIEDGRARRLRGNPAHPVTQGFLCAKVTRYLDHVYNPNRLLHALRRKRGGGFEPIGWDQAMDEITARLTQLTEEYGPECVMPYSYAGTMGLIQGESMDRRFFHRLGASRLDRTICSSAGGAALAEAYGARLGTAPEDFARARYIIAWGANILTTNVHLWPFIVEARRNGARLVVIDPVRTKLAKLADWHLAPYPGSDLALALGVMHVMFAEGLTRCEQDTTSLRDRASEYTPERVAELTGIAAADIVRLAREYATTEPAVIRVNYGVQRSERGGRAVQAIALLPALVGAWRQRGGGLQLTTSGAFALNYDALMRPDLGPAARTLNMSTLGRALTEVSEPPVKALIVYNSNPAAIAPNQALVRRGLERDDLFTVVLEQTLSDTAQYADYVLPATTFLEHADLYYSYGHYYLQMTQPVLAAPGECRPNTDVFRALAQRMGFTEPCFADSDETMIRQALDSKSPYLEGITYERLAREHFVRLNVAELPMAGRAANLDATKLAYAPPAESRLGTEQTSEYPLELVSSKNHDSMNSTFALREDVDAQTAVLEMHAEDARRRGIGDGDAVEVFNARGRLQLAARVGDYTRPGVVRAPMVRRGLNANVLVGDRLTDIGGGPCFYNCLVEVRRCGESA